ncbi:MAG: hypothetical protein AAGF98_06610 [Cyanobacteria bacterium P01_H01_bin.153]
MVKQFVELQRGTLQVASKVGQGSTFTVRLPMTLPVSSEETPASVARP